MTKEEVLQKVQDVVNAPSVYSGLKDVAEAYLASVGKDNEQEMARALIKELKDDVQSLDDVIPFFASEKAKEIFGADQAAAMLKMAKEHKANGEHTCFCPACQAGQAVLDNADVLLA